MGYDHAWYVHRITAAKVQKLETGKDAIAMAFSDAHTLWVLRSVKGKLAIVRIADAKAQVERKLDLDGLQNAFEPVTWPGALVAATDGSVWLLGCNPNDKAAGTPACKRLYLRVDNDAFTVAKTHPKAIDTFAKRPEPIDAPPAGYRAQIHGHSYACNGPKGQHFAYQAMARDAYGLAWLSASPAVLRANLTAGCGNDMSGDLDDLVDCNDEAVSYVIDCKTYIDDVRTLPDGVLAVSKDSKSWQLYKAGRVIGTLPGGAELMVAP